MLSAFLNGVNVLPSITVMELLRGEDMSVLRNESRRALSPNSHSKRIEPHSADSDSKSSQYTPLPLAGAAHLAKEMLLCIQDFHAAGFVHRGKY